MTVLLVIVDLLLLLGLTLRLIRAVVFDDIGRWWIRDPLARWAIRHDGMPSPKAFKPPVSGNYRWDPERGLQAVDGLTWANGTPPAKPVFDPSAEWESEWPIEVYGRGAVLDKAWVEAFTAKEALRMDYERVSDPHGWRSKVVSGLSCPWCVGFWIAGLTVATLLAAGGPGSAHWLWRAVAGWWALSYVAAHIGPRLGDTG